MKTKEINLLVFDTKENYERTKDFLGEPGIAFKRVLCVPTRKEFDQAFNELPGDEPVYLVVHVFKDLGIAGIRSFIASNINKDYKEMGWSYISEGKKEDIQTQSIEHGINGVTEDKIWRYHQVQTGLENREKIYTKAEIILLQSSSIEKEVEDSKYPRIDVAVITALYEDEFTELQKVFDFPKKEQIRTKRKIYHIGYLKVDKSKKIVASVQAAAGMVDASIVATQMLEFFKPKYLIMTGVCGGSKKLTFGDVVIAKSIFTFQKGKLNDLKVKNPKTKELEDLVLYDAEKRKVDYQHLYDAEGTQVVLGAEKFEREDEAIELDDIIKELLEEANPKIQAKINESIVADHLFESKTIAIKLEPMACSTMVINRDGHFEDTILAINRKTSAVEMESFGVARACRFANDGLTVPIIIKSVMDHASQKQDNHGGINYKKFAAYTSAQYLKNLLEMEVLPFE